jgi:hypothetical protein
MGFARLDIEKFSDRLLLCGKMSAMISRQLIPAVVLALATLSARADVKMLPNPCGVLTEQDVSTLAGAPAKISMKMDAAGMCMFSAGKTNFSVRGMVADSPSAAAEMFTSMTRTAGTGQMAVQNLTGIGDRAAIFVTPTGDLKMLIQKQTTFLELNLGHPLMPNPAVFKDKMIQAGKTAVGRI